MKTLSIFLILLVIHAITFGQEKLAKDLDMDGKNDSIYVDTEASVIVCQLSGNRFKKIKSQPIDILNEQSGITATRNGFEFFNNWMRAGYHNQFRYDPKTMTVRLIGMSRYEFGNAANDGSGESSVNLLTGDYIGDWNYYDMDKSELIKIPTIKTKMKFAYVSLESFSDKNYFDYAEQCSRLYDTYKTKVKR